MIRKGITSVAELGDDWTLLGVESGDRSIVQLKDRDCRFVAFVKTKTKDANGEDIEVVLIIGQKKWLSSEKGSAAMNALMNSRIQKKAIPIMEQSLLIEIYKEWERKVKDGAVNVKNSEEEAYDNVVEVEQVLEQCLKDGVSDIHIEVRENTAQIRRRINGSIKVLKRLGVKQGESWGRTIYNVMSTVGGAMFKPNKPQDALIDRDFGFVRLRGRVATAPVSPSGFTMVIRLLKIQNATKPLTTEELGYSKRERNKISFAMAKSKGMICVSGTTGSGKSTTLQNLLMTKILERNGEIAVMTVEDPPEYFIPAASQIPVVRDDNGSAKEAFAGAIRTALRCDPDLLMVGEIRDEESAQVVKEVVDTGHPVYTTVHASGCIQTIGRLDSLGIGRDTLSSPTFISGFFYQKLLPKVCKDCAKTIKDGRVPVRYSERDFLVTLGVLSEEAVMQHYKAYLSKSIKINFIRYLQDLRVLEPEQADFVASTYQRLNKPEELDALYERICGVADIKTDNILFRGEGCSSCKGTGVIGRTVASEGMTTDMQMLEMIADGADRDLMIYWKKNKDGKFAIDDAIEKMKLGLVDPVDIEHELDLIGSSII